MARGHEFAAPYRATFNYGEDDEQRAAFFAERKAARLARQQAATQSGQVETKANSPQPQTAMVNPRSHSSVLGSTVTFTKPCRCLVCRKPIAAERMAKNWRTVTCSDVCATIRHKQAMKQWRQSQKEAK